MLIDPRSYLSFKLILSRFFQEQLGQTCAHSLNLHVGSAVRLLGVSITTVALLFTLLRR